MMVGVVEGATRIIGKCQGYHGLPVRDELISCTVNGEGTPAMTTAWVPTPAELEAIKRGAAVHVRLLGLDHPPISVEVGPMPDPIAID
jgi:hypothetical protein